MGGIRQRLIQGLATKDIGELYYGTAAWAVSGDALVVNHSRNEGYPRALLAFGVGAARSSSIVIGGWAKKFQALDRSSFNGRCSFSVNF